MKSKKVAQYDYPAQFEPLMPAPGRVGPLLERAADLTRAAAALASSVASSAHTELRTLLRSMNSYYTNRIEGEHTRPADIERALRKDFSNDLELAHKQRLAVAHIAAEEHCETDLASMVSEGKNAVRWLYSTEALRHLHTKLFAGLDAGSTLAVGHFRTRQVAVGRHEPPEASALDAFLGRWAEVYGQARRGEESVVAAMASHHRLAWIHPFEDGNGRVARLHTHLVLHAMDLTGGLWSPLRGFARTEERYKALLQAADEHRRGDLDGRGNLSEAALVEWTGYALDVCVDQVDFMRGMLNVQGMQGRIEAALIFEESALKSGVRREALRPLHYLFSTQAELARADFKTMTGLGERVATDLVSALIRRGFLATDSPYGALRFAVPRPALQFYFPDLWPEAQKDAEPSVQARATAKRPKP